MQDSFIQLIDQMMNGTRNSDVKNTLATIKQSCADEENLDDKAKYQMAKQIVQSYPEGEQIQWTPYLAMCKDVPRISHLWRQHPQKFNLYQQDCLAIVTKTTAREVLMKPSMTENHYIGAVDPNETDPLVPMAQKPTNGEMIYFYGEFHGTKEWMQTTLNLNPEFFENNKKERYTKQVFFDFVAEAENYFSPKKIKQTEKPQQLAVA